MTLLFAFVAAGVIIQIAHQVVNAHSTQAQVDAGQRVVYGLRYRLFQHLQALPLRHHVNTSVGELVYRVDVDAYAIENLLLGGFPLVASVATLVVMFGVLLKLDASVALLSLAVVPFLYLCIRYYINTLMAREENVALHRAIWEAVRAAV